ncbi:MAG: homocysteine S-methyltransferase family protein [Oscillospiraceae bacterium]|jgi:5-methyltetrahydrofolate--homocysteine methyltransferase|nr:homocysteine S-methyltransferase family protein [Oscillospiraceae bacterium]
MAILFDGAMGTQLISKVGDLGKFPELMNSTHSKAVKEVHLSYAEAGTQITISNSFMLSPHRALIGEYDFDEILRKSLLNAMSAGKPVALDVGPLGVMLEPYGDFTADDVYNEFAKMITFGSSVVDYILLETFADLREVEIALRAANECCTKPVFVTMTFQPDGVTYMGATVEQFAACANMCAANALGFNCTVDPIQGREIFERFKACTDLPLIVQPNQLADPNEFADAMMWYVERGADYVGGCCGTTPEHIKALAQKML